MTDDEIERRARALTLAGGSPNTHAAAARWLESLNVAMVDVWFLRADRTWDAERQVDDPVTLDETIVMAMGRLRAHYALRLYRGRWELRGGKPSLGFTRYYDTREAAEMVALHGG